MGTRPSDEHSIDRIDVNGHYEPGNCRWATRTEQARNQRNVVFLEHEGVRLPLAEWAERLGLSTQCLRNRLRAGWPPERVFASEKHSRAPKTPRKPGGHHDGRSLTREYRAWKAMVQRCTNPAHFDFPRYGARGIDIHPAWLAYDRFLADLGSCPEGCQLGRRDTSKGYHPGNVCWMTRTEAMRASTAVRHLEHAGECWSISEWSERRGIPLETIRGRLKMHWTVAQALGFEPRLTSRGGSSEAPRVEGFERAPEWQR